MLPCFQNAGILKMFRVKSSKFWEFQNLPKMRFSNHELLHKLLHSWNKPCYSSFVNSATEVRLEKQNTIWAIRIQKIVTIFSQQYILQLRSLDHPHFICGKQPKRYQSRSIELCAQDSFSYPANGLWTLSLSNFFLFRIDRIQKIQKVLCLDDDTS